MSKTVLLLIDLQRDFLENDGRLPVPVDCAERVIGAANRMIDYARKSGWTMIWIKNEFLRTQWISNFFRNHAAIKGTPGADIDPRINFYTETPIMVKCEADAFSNPRLEILLKKATPEKVIILGLMTDECVAETTRGVIRRGYPVEIVEDGVATMEEPAHEKALAAMRACGAMVKKSVDILGS